MQLTLLTHLALASLALANPTPAAAAAAPEPTLPPAPIGRLLFADHTHGNYLQSSNTCLKKLKDGVRLAEYSAGYKCAFYRGPACDAANAIGGNEDGLRGMGFPGGSSFDIGEVIRAVRCWRA
ncbi:hypothetical protein BDV95DRAFT_592127 [Massariosphaeria phaeospora]|uniref:Beta/gamma crystallin 'Greek key' domain-containing protein n=1 Tax=Massariosphaeria phaeospora TaxID=100035 RepID=A0A7C8MDI4_9PLEO|nr:hypothetical protein BDV95DRAFT_592127 [Massariosphaeria phaeospora]